MKRNKIGNHKIGLDLFKKQEKGSYTNPIFYPSLYGLYYSIPTYLTLFSFYYDYNWWWRSLSFN